MATASGAPLYKTAQQILQRAARDSKLIGRGDDLSDSDFVVEGIDRLNDLINFLCTKGLKLFIQEDYGLTTPLLQEGQGVYAFGLSGNPAGSVLVPMSKPRRIIEAYFTDSNQVRRPLILMSRNEWNTLATVTTVGTITGYFPDKQLLTVNLNLWEIPNSIDATGTVHCVLDTQVGNFQGITDTMAFPPEWAMALQWGLAHEWSSGQPSAVIAFCKERSMYYQTALEDWDVEDASTSFQPDSRARFVGRDFSS